jgi:recombination protein RecA
MSSLFSVFPLQRWGIRDTIHLQRNLAELYFAFPIVLQKNGGEIMAPKKATATKTDKVTKTSENPQEEKLKALEHALADLDKQYGKGAVMKLGENVTDQNIPVIPTGCLTLDAALGVGGIPRGRIVEIYGPESSGKTTVALHIIAEAQKAGGIAAFVDAEHALDPAYAKKLGVNIDELYVSQPDTGEQALEIAEALVRSGALDVVVIDSVAALVPKAEIDGEMGDSFVGLQARLMSQALRKLAGIINKTGCVAIFINQLREKVGVMYGNPETTPGGRALKFYASVRLDVRRGEQLKEGSTVVGNHTKVKVVKNKVAPPFRIAEFDIVYGEGISKEGTLLDLAVERDIIHKSGAWFSYKDQRIGQGRENTRQFLKAHPEIADEIDAIIRAELIKTDNHVVAETPAEEGEEEPETFEEEDDLALLEEDLPDEE